MLSDVSIIQFYEDLKSKGYSERYLEEELKGIVEVGEYNSMMVEI